MSSSPPRARRESAPKRPSTGEPLAPATPAFERRPHEGPHTTTSGALLAAAAAPLGILGGNAAQFVSAPRWIQVTSAAVAALLALAALVIVRRPRLGQALATLGIAGTMGLGTPVLLASPVAALAALLAATSAVVLLWKVGAPLIHFSRERKRPVAEGRAQGAAGMAFALWLLWILGNVNATTGDVLAVGWAAAVATLLAIAWLIGRLRTNRVRALVVLGALVLGLALAATSWGDWWWTATGPAIAAAVSAVAIRPSRRAALGSEHAWDPLLGHPERLFVGTFAALCVGGAMLLLLPQSAATGESIGFIDALFTATSAVCVTGLIVLDTPVDFSGFGQVIILLLIQIGGLGIMTFSTAALWALGRRLSLRHEGAVASLISTRDRGRLYSSARRILVFTVTAEGIGALLLALAFALHGDGIGMALWRGLFTAISAFCNAGFALQSASLVPYQESPFVLHVVAMLIILGGLSPLVVFAIPPLLRRAPRPVSAQVRLALAASAALLVGGFVLILAFEWDQSLRDLSVVGKLHNAWFQSVTLRTAGFNSIELSGIRSATLLLMLVWMFIGGTPGGTAGGVKTTTVSVLALSVVYAIRGRWRIETFGRRIPDRTLAKAAVVLSIAMTTGFIALLAVFLTQKMAPRVAGFEVVSALGTVGLSIGGTAMLDGIGKVILVVCMFVGRVGGLTLLMFMKNRREPPLFGYPEEEIDVG